MSTDGVLVFYVKIYEFMLANTWLPFAACSVYFASIVLGQLFRNTTCLGLETRAGSLESCDCGIFILGDWRILCRYYSRRQDNYRIKSCRKFSSSSKIL